MNEINMIESFFKSHQILLSRPWLESCIEWCKEENLPATYSLKDLQYSVFEQWLLLDLREVEVPSLPSDLSSKIKFTLTGNYSLQLMYVVDISKPKYWQIQRIRNGIPKNVEQEAESSKRVLLLTLTDGVQQVEAMELTPIQCLNLNLPPGIKIKLMGPIDVRRGRLILEEKNVKVFGGEVDSLVVENAAENILAKHLKLPLNPTPLTIQESLLSANMGMVSETGMASNISSTTQNNSNTSFQHPSLNHQPTSNAMNVNTSNSWNNAPKPMNSIRNSTEVRNNLRNTVQLTRDEIDYHELEEQRMNEELAILMEVERDFEETQAKRRKTNKTPDMSFDDMEISDSEFENIVIPEPVIATGVEAVNKTSANLETVCKPTTSENNQEVVDLSDSLELENDVFEDLDIDAHLDKIDRENGVSEPKLWTIDDLVKNMPNITNDKFKIRGKFKSIVEKMTIIDDEFHLVIKVEDETGDISVRLHNNIVANYTGVSAVDLMKLKTEIAENNAVAQGKFLGALKSLKEKLVELDELAEVQVNVREKFPVVLKFL
ncbi:uncharacterized protein [Leptinotarsa decemlineata]|uniref:uncharacterized protein n=1 Tax=Leptinotarsa decemlineata TaxID=7539 RepID=UPI003D30B35E